MVKSLADVLDSAVNKSTLSRAEADLIQEHLSEIQSTKGIRDTSMLARGHDLIRSAEYLHKAGGTYDHFTTAQALKTVSGVRNAAYTVRY